MAETKIGTVTHYFSHLNVAAVDVTNGDLHTGDKVHIKGHTSDFEQAVASIQLEHQPIEVARPGQSVGISVIKHAREHDTVYKVT